MLHDVAHAICELVEKVDRIVRTRGCFRVILDAECNLILYANAFNSVIVQIDVGDLYPVGFSDLIGIYGKAVILGGDLTLAGEQILYRVVDSTVAVVHFISGDATRFSQ